MTFCASEIITCHKYVITGSASLRVLDISNNPIGDDGILLISKELQCSDTLTQLRVAMCGLSVEGSI